MQFTRLLYKITFCLQVLVHHLKTRYRRKGEIACQNEPILYVNGSYGRGFAY